MFDSLIWSINNFDIFIFNIININMHNQIFNVIMPLITLGGTQIFWIVICVFLYVFGGNKGKIVAILCLIGLLVGYFITEGLKHIIERPRPFDLIHANVLTNINGFSFPSGHSVSAFIGSTIIGIKYGIFFPLTIFASVVGFSRIYLGVHYPSDVIAGALIGIIISLVILKFEKNILNFKDRLAYKIKVNP
jgi:undecaprenyl-diphosphatase